MLSISTVCTCIGEEDIQIEERVHNWDTGHCSTHCCQAAGKDGSLR